MIIDGHKMSLHHEAELFIDSPSVRFKLDIQAPIGGHKEIFQSIGMIKSNQIAQNGVAIKLLCDGVIIELIGIVLSFEINDELGLICIKIKNAENPRYQIQFNLL